MTISAIEFEIPRARSVRITSDTLHVDLSDGRTISVPVGWYPRLAHATAEERRQRARAARVVSADAPIEHGDAQINYCHFFAEVRARRRFPGELLPSPCARFSRLTGTRLEAMLQARAEPTGSV